MHRSIVAAISLFSLAAAVAPARASVITQVVGPEVQDQGPPAFPVAADFFQPSSGTLTGVKLELKGTVVVRADIEGATNPALTTSLLVFPVRSSPDSFTISFPSEPTTSHGIVGEGPAVLWVGASITVDETFAFSDVSPFIDTNPAPQNLIDYGFSSTSSSGALALDRTSFNGSAVLTYTYSAGTTAPTGVPEPASASLIGFGATALALMRRRAGHRRQRFMGQVDRAPGYRLRHAWAIW